jgi:hypothetical protein
MQIAAQREEHKIQEEQATQRFSSTNIPSVIRL